MKRLTVVLMLMVTITSIGLSQQSAVIREARGKVMYQIPGRTWQNVSAGMELPLTTTISTGFDSLAVLDLGRSIIEVKQLTRMRVDELAQTEQSISTKLYLNVGRVRAKVEQVENLNHDFTFISSQSVCSVRGTDFEYDGNSLICYEGVVLLSNLLQQKRTAYEGEVVITAVYETPQPPAQVAEAASEVSTATYVSDEQEASEENIQEQNTVPSPAETAPSTPTTGNVTTTLIWPD